MVYMISSYLTFDKYIIYVDLHCFPNVIFKHGVHKALVGGSCVF